MSERRWWYLNKKGDPIMDLGMVIRPEDAHPANGDEATPWYKLYNHLHGRKGTAGIHYHGTLEEAQAELRLAWRGESYLPEDVCEVKEVERKTNDELQKEWLKSRGKLFDSTRAAIEAEQLAKKKAEAKLPELKSSKFSLLFEAVEVSSSLDEEANRLLTKQGINTEKEPWLVDMLVSKMMDIVCSEIEVEFDLEDRAVRKICLKKR